MRKQIYRQISNFLANKKLVRGFTITELIVAVGLLAAVLAASTMVFHYAIEAQRTAMATAEIMRTLRSITDQLNMDFAGLRTTDAPMIIKFHGDPNDANKTDSIVFFANGNFQTSDGSVTSPVARIYYGQSAAVGSRHDPNSLNINVRRDKILARKQVLIAPGLPLSPTGEYDINDISQQMNAYLIDPNVGDVWIRRPAVDINDANYISMYLAKGVDNFTIKYCSTADIDAISHIINWQPPNNLISQIPFQRFGFGPPPPAVVNPYPSLIRFTFTLYDSKKILKTGRKFEHIVYISQ